MTDASPETGSVPRCPTHGDTMKSMENVGAPDWYTCAASALIPGGVCGYSAHGDPSTPSLA